MDTAHAHSPPGSARRRAEHCFRAGLLALLLWAAPAAALSPAPHFLGDEEELSEAGYLTLRWSVPEDAVPDESEYRYQVDLQAGPGRIPHEILYEGAANSSFLSGLVDGEYRFRVRARHADAPAWGDWSATKVVEVRHHSKALALRLCALGGALFLITAGFVIRHAFDDDSDLEEEQA